jgi:hypothetical protein
VIFGCFEVFIFAIGLAAIVRSGVLVHFESFQQTLMHGVEELQLSLQEHRMTLEGLQALLMLSMSVYLTNDFEFCIPNRSMVVRNLLLDAFYPLFDESTLDASRIIALRHDTVVGRLITERASSVDIS